MMGDYFTKKEQIVILIIAFIIILTIGFKMVYPNIGSSKKQVLSLKTHDDEELIVKHREVDENKNKDKIEDDESDIIMIHISGQVYRPGIVELEYGKRLIDAIELAGGLTEEANIDSINLAKKLSDEEKIYIPKIGEESDLSLNIDLMDENNKSNKVNINTCTIDELKTLPGIGDVIAGRIIEYRQSNGFKNIEDLMNVSGIGNKKFEDLKDLVTVEWGV